MDGETQGIEKNLKEIDQLEKNYQQNSFNQNSFNLNNQKSSKGFVQRSQQVSQTQPQPVEFDILDGAKQQLQQKQQQQMLSRPQSEIFHGEYARTLPNQQNRYMLNAINNNNNIDQDVTDKVHELEKNLNYCLEQLQTNERTMQHEQKKLKMLMDSELERRNKLESNMKFSEETNLVQLNEFVNRINALEQRAQASDKLRNEMREKLAISEMNQKEMLNFLQGVQSQGNTELLSMRGMMQDRLNEETTSLTKERDKSKALFEELVRLGEVTEKQEEKISILELAIEGRVGGLESGKMMVEKRLEEVQGKGEGAMTQVVQWNQKLENRVQQLEATLFVLGREQVRDKENITKVDVTNQKMSEQIRDLLMNLSNDYSSRLDVKMTELVNRIVMEHEERVKSLDELKQQINLKEKLNTDKQNYEREEMRDRFISLDSLVRAELSRKDEQLKIMQEQLEGQVRSLTQLLKEEETHRGQQDAIFREDFVKLQSLIQTENDFFKTQQDKISEKTVEMIKIEVDTRLTSDVDLKNLVNSIASDIITDVNNFKEVLELQTKKIAEQFKQQAIESGDRASQLSHYIDGEVRKIVTAFQNKHQKMKIIFSKLAEQFKNHLIHYEAQRKDMGGKILQVENSLNEAKNELEKKMTDGEEKLTVKINENEMIMTELVESKCQVQEDKANKLQELLEYDVNMLKDITEQNKQTMLAKQNNFQKLFELFQNEYQNQQLALLEHTDLIQQKMEEFEKEYQLNVSSIGSKLIELDAKIHSEVLSERTLRNTQIGNLLQQFSSDDVMTSQKIQNCKTMIENEQRDRNKAEEEIGKKITDAESALNDAQKLISYVENNLNKYMEFSKQQNTVLESEMATQRMIEQTEKQQIKSNLQGLVDNMLSKNDFDKQFQNQVIEDYTKMKETLNQLNNSLIKNLDQAFERKIQFWFEKFKKENQEVWEDTIQKVHAGFDDIENLYDDEKNPDVNKLNELQAFQDLYNRHPLIK